MRKPLLITACFALITIAACAKDIKYPVSSIPEELKKGVNLVVREDEMIIRIFSKKSYTVHVHFAVTIFNSNGQDYASTAVFYDKNIKLRDLKAAAYNADGEVIRKLKSSEITDRSAFDGSLFSDNRIKSFDLSQGTFPYTVEWEYDRDYNYLYSIEGSSVLSKEKMSVQHFMYQLNYPVDLKPRYKAKNMTVEPVIARVGTTESITWTLDNVPPIKMEPLASLADYVMHIEAAPTTFEYDGYAGNMATWEDYGKWNLLLNKDRDVLPEEVKKKVKDLTAGLKTNEEKAKALYEYMQSKTRYVSIQLGIGGLQPFDAATVDKTGYGDCKALSNYMVSMLKEAGIKSFYTTVMAGVDAAPVDPTFPSHQANHVIVAIPNEKDTLWLECTSQRMPFGYIGRFTDNRYATMITENGGKLVKTRHYPGEGNVQTTLADVHLDATGNAKAKVRTNYTGLQYENGGLDDVLNLSAEEQKKWIQNNTEIPTFVVDDFSMINKKAKMPTATVAMSLTLNKYASVSNKRIFLTPNLMNKSTFLPEKVESRKTPFVLRLGYTDIDTIRYHIPESIYPEFLPPDTKFTSRFGTYEAGFKLDQGSLIYVRKMTRKDGQFPAESYQELIDFYKSVNKADNTKLVFLNKT
ncbi:MAG TPA: DUF3857 domain-containing transglutaminase family protein [Cyclobacteriaceae bacterium]|nr:DUF3857 domain-containing transglutaminase family protein [Cyclobacteriaceae bacterium]